MLSGKIIIPLITKNNKTFQYQIISSFSKKLLLNSKCYFASKKTTQQNSNKQLISYTPIRPLKKSLTQLFIQSDFLNKGKVKRGVPFWPYLTPFYAMIINNYFTTWSTLNSTITIGLLFIGLMFRFTPMTKNQAQIVKFQCNQQLTKYYITVLYTIRSAYLSMQYQKHYNGFQNWNVFDQQDLKNNQYIPTEQQKKKLSQIQIELKKQEFDLKLFKKIAKQTQIQKSIRRFELNAANTAFKLSNDWEDIISDSQILHPDLPLKMPQFSSIPYKYLIIRTQFMSRRNNPEHFFIELKDNGDLRYQDYLIALGAHYKLNLSSELK